MTHAERVSTCSAVSRPLGYRAADRRRGIAEKRLRQSNQLLYVQLVRLAWRVRPRVGDAIIDRGNAGRVWIAQIGYLYGRNPPCEHGQPLALRMAGKLDQDIELIVAQDPF